MMLHVTSSENLKMKSSPVASPDNRLLATKGLFWLILALLIVISARPAYSGDLDDVLKAGKLRHLGIVYANFITPDKQGLDVELMQQFASHLGVGYEFVETTWGNVVTDLTGKVIKPDGDEIEIVGSGPVRGDVISTGFTVLEWRNKIVDFSEMTFPTGVWLISRADSKLQPVSPSGDISKDVSAVKHNLKGVSVLGLKDSCLDPKLYQIAETGAEIQLFPSDRDLSEMIPSVMARMADTTLMDVPVALIALEEWPGQIKVVGPVSKEQSMACAFAKTSPKLREAFAKFFTGIKQDGTYRKLVEKYYPSLFMYYPEVF